MPIFPEEFRKKEQTQGRKNVGTLEHLPFKGEEETGSEQKVETSIVPAPTAGKGTWKQTKARRRHI